MKKYYLQELKAEYYLYPYQQLIGFYLEKAGYPTSQFESFKKLQSPYRFYLDYAIANPVLDNTWNIYFPKGLDK